MASVEAKYAKTLKIIASNIKRLRKERKLAQAAMTKHGFDLRNYQRLEAGDHSPSLFTLQKLAIAFRVEMTAFFE